MLILTDQRLSVAIGNKILNRCASRRNKRNFDHFIYNIQTCNYIHSCNSMS